MRNMLPGIFIAILTFSGSYIIERSIPSIFNSKNNVASVAPVPNPVEVVSLSEIPTSPEEIQTPENPYENDPDDFSGYYYPENGKGSVRHLWISLWTEDKKNSISGEVRTNKRNYEFASAQLADKTLKFKTQKIKGVEYKFEGTFIYKGNFWDAGYNEFVMRGVLRKFLNGKEVGRIKTRYVFTVGC